ncbi:Rv3654c family TadE-like protein [Actinomycetospora cinnamomea]|uniref:Secretion/DNA translocation related TadE-like protein n=1 Tax=Actinomycetospora cinnamomea TaxID=663609 RepID=A0A2U1FB40_9PSEU|nr:Rv3654c family TadE-like protein [Actinomycetospora cinnamomea]PVZ09384.1 secretion/DNA translocation related TadE-like protein [Actinomycetospora cinnamomea]
MSGTAGGRWRRAEDTGAVTVLAAAAVGVLVLLLGLGLQVGAATLARHRAETAADLAALAGAREVVRGRDVACARAADVVATNGARLVHCAVEGWTVIVITASACGCMPSVSGDAAGHARAGPVAAEGPPSGRPPVTGGDR